MLTSNVGVIQGEVRRVMKLRKHEGKSGSQGDANKKLGGGYENILWGVFGLSVAIALGVIIVPKVMNVMRK